MCCYVNPLAHESKTQDMYELWGIEWGFKGESTFGCFKGWKKAMQKIRFKIKWLRKILLVNLRSVGEWNKCFYELC